MIKRHKDLLRAIVGEMRHTLVGYHDGQGNWVRGDLDRELERIGVAPDGGITPIDALLNPTPIERRTHVIAEARLSAVPQKERMAARAELVERAAYSWINRLLALRAMEARDLIDETLRQNPDYDGIPEALYVLRLEQPGRATGPDGGWWAVIEDACDAQAASLPGLFDLKDPSVAMRPTTAAMLRCIAAVGGAPAGYALDEADAAFADPDAIGWAYQFYQEEPKKETYEKLNKGGKAATRSEIAAVTQLFTEPYMVHWLLENSLGRSYHEMFPDSKLPDTWEYYIKPEQLDKPAYLGLASLTVMDPCCGSGHFLRVAFDMLVDMYREQQSDLGAAQIADRILSKHLHGIDIDPRAAQLAALSLYLRAWELVSNERRANRRGGRGKYAPPALSIAATPTGLTEGALERHLQRHPEDNVLKPLLTGIFAALEQADILGSLIQPGQYIDKAIAALRKPQTTMSFDGDEASLRQTITHLANEDPDELKRVLLDRIAESFTAEAGTVGDTNSMLFGNEAAQGVRLVQLLSARYGVVVTNPPYMGSKNMGLSLKGYIEVGYPTGKGDLYSAFILRCLELCRHHGRVAMVTMQDWMFLSTFATLRALPQDRLAEAARSRKFRGILQETRIEALVHLGPNSFEEISGAVVQSVMFTLNNNLPRNEEEIFAIRLVGADSISDKRTSLKEAVATPGSPLIFRQTNRLLLELTGSPILYWLSPSLLSKIIEGNTLDKSARVVKGISTAENTRFVRFHWETAGQGNRWLSYAKGGGYKKWFGLGWYSFDWENDGARLKAFNSELYGGGSWTKNLRNLDLFGRPGLIASKIASGNLSFRVHDGEYGFDNAALFVQSSASEAIPLLADLNTRVAAYIVRALNQSIIFEPGYVGRIPLSPTKTETSSSDIVEICVMLARLESATNPVEKSFHDIPNNESDFMLTAVLRHTIEGELEQRAVRNYALDEATQNMLLQELGTPAGWFPLIDGYDELLAFPSSVPIALAGKVAGLLANRRRKSVSRTELETTKFQLQSLYQSGPSATALELAREAADETDFTNEPMAYGVRPLPTETFLEELSAKVQIHPVTVFRIVEELRTTGVRCLPEEQRLAEDRISVLALRLLGHRWPKQIEAEDQRPDWVDQDGVIPLAQGTDEVPLAERVRMRLRAEDGELEAQRVEALLVELTGMTLEDWLQKRFFKRHVQQFKSRPIAWHLASTPQAGSGKGVRGPRRAPCFECMVYYHACSGDVLARIRTQYVEPLLRNERRKAEEARLAQDETAAALATSRVQELEDYIGRLREVENNGFASDELDKVLATEPLDRWSGDGYVAPPSREELLHQERAWRVDLNDGVRVNIAPLQMAGLLAADVLKAADARKAIEDRARWRADERRWVREGKLPRCGWLDEAVPESTRWRELAPQRAEEAAKLARKRNVALGKTSDTQDLPLFESSAGK